MKYDCWKSFWTEIQSLLLPKQTSLYNWANKYPFFSAARFAAALGLPADKAFPLPPQDLAFIWNMNPPVELANLQMLQEMEYPGNTAEVAGAVGAGSKGNCSVEKTEWSSKFYFHKSNQKINVN